MTLDSFRPKSVAWFRPFARGAGKIGLTPDGCTILAFIAAILAGVAFYYSDVLLGALLVFLNAFFDAIDGALARETGVAGPYGDFLDHVLDRYADVFIICGVFAGPLAPWPVGVFALTGVLLASYLGTQAQAIGVGRFYGGLLGRADRLVLLIVVGILSFFIPQTIAGMYLMGWLLLLFGILGHITAIQRFVHVIHELKQTGADS